ncbi:Cell division protein FtsI/penicillin-binding protein 2 [Marinilactibacillus piezotolerans]|uniref:Cell division protein FtsI/penicillin-binding protein 2 n=1 Tax=Marinilactibacillus piezotolerans TaxID=258723 RepID=A0A1I3V4N2_9LACT|nr:Cell division protein FtsI/penicillin-binding protein 2 [Marinilactibacillus piezotolerans]
MLRKTIKKTKERKKSHIPFRLNLLFFIVFMLFSALILRLGYLQIIRADEYRAEVERTERTTITGSVPRGEIYDANLTKLVGNEARNTITYTRGKNTSGATMAEIALNLADYITMPSVSPFDNEDSSDITVRDMQDFYIAMNQDEVNERLSDEELKLSGSESYQAMLDKVTEDEIADFSEKEKAATAIYKSMNASYSLSTVNIKNENVSQEEIARVSENLDSLPGVGTGTDWVRVYPQGDMLKSVLGRVTSEEQGIPSEKVSKYLAMGYSRNDRVGRTYLEEQYESVLRGTKSIIETETDNNGEIINQVEKYSGSKGDNLILTSDISYQETVEQIAKDSLQKREGRNEEIYMAAMDPQTGDILAMTGQTVGDDGEAVDDALGTITKAFIPGSSIKGATVLSAYMDGVLDTSNNVIEDTPLLFKGSNPIRSIFNQSGSIMINDITALERSSNVYMSRLAMRMGGVWDYSPYKSLPFNGQELLDKQREYYAQFGLGVETGIDLPSEMTGYKGSNPSAVDGLFQAFGQYDTYTTIQLLQYVSTIANDGVRVAPKLVSEIRDTDPDTGEIGALKTEIETKVLNKVAVSDEAMDRVQQGFYQAVHGDQGTARSFFADAPYDAAGKTGTAQSFWYNPETKSSETTVNLTYVGYAPYDDPEIAVAVIVPYLPESSSERTNKENLAAAKRMMDAYFKTGEFEEEQKSNTETVEELQEAQNAAENVE